MKEIKSESKDFSDLLHVWCACGPFSSSKTLSYEQLCDLIELVKKERPHILILVSAKHFSVTEKCCAFLRVVKLQIGPFIDRTSPVVKSPQCCYTYDDLMGILLAKIDEALSGFVVRVYLTHIFTQIEYLAQYFNDDNL